MRQAAVRRQWSVLEHGERPRRPASRRQTGPPTPWTSTSRTTAGHASGSTTTRRSRPSTRVLRERHGRRITASFADRASVRLRSGMDHTWMTHDGSGHSTNVFFGLQSTCPDLARFGTPLRPGRGCGTDEQVVPAVPGSREAVGAPSQQLNAGVRPAVVAQPSRAPSSRLDEATPTPAERRGAAERGARELYAAQGLGGQVVLVDPRHARRSWSGSADARTLVRPATRSPMRREWSLRRWWHRQAAPS